MAKIEGQTHHTTRKEEDHRQTIHNKDSEPWNRRHKFRHDPKDGVEDTTPACENGEAVLDWTDGWIVAGFGVFREEIGRGDGEGEDYD